jgi:hypothetical protein
MTTIGAIEKRVRRKLLDDGLALCKPRNESMKREYGEYHIVDIRTNSIHASNCELMDLAKELNVIRPWEKVE